MNVINIKSVLFFLDLLDPNLPLWKLNQLVETSPVHKTKNLYKELQLLRTLCMYLLTYRGKVLMGRVKSWA